MKTNNGQSEEYDRKWWKEAIVYQIYPRSFQDSNGDGIGDIPGIISRLDYVKSLGIDVIWLNPIFASPNDDNGYDICDYYRIMDEMGTMGDFDRLLDEIHARNMKLILDLVVNHTSDEHAWFQEGRKSRENPYYSFYHWWPAEKGTPPFRASIFDAEGDAWEYNPPTDSYYLHYFSFKQPDLNWENPQVRDEIYKMMRFWLDKGIDGFRLDAITLIGKDMSYPEIKPVKSNHDVFSDDIFQYYLESKETHRYLQEMNREVLSRYDIMTVGEASGVKSENAWEYVDPERHELNMIYHFGHSDVHEETEPTDEALGINYNLVEFKKTFTEWDEAVGNGWPAVYLGNHDQSRMVSRFGNDAPEFRELSSKMLATFLMTVRGTPYWYAGDEIGMTNIRFDDIEDYKDISTRNEYERIKKGGGDTRRFLEMQKETSRDNGRTPFQWDATSRAGFTEGVPWLKVNPDHTEINVEKEDRERDSILNYFRRLVALRKENPVWIYGTCKLIDRQNVQIYAYLRELGEVKHLVLLNFSSQTADVDCPFPLSVENRILGNYTDFDKKSRDGKFSLRPFEALIFVL